MKLYYSKGSCSLAIRILINELGLDSEFEAVDLKTKKTEHGEDYLTQNPKGAVPALKLNNGEILTENTVIQQYLADEHEATNVLPPVHDLKRYRVLEWLNFVSTDLHKSCSPLFNPQVPAEIKESVFKVVLKSKLKYVNEHLKDNTYLLGGTYTLPDGYLFVVLRWMERLEVDLKEFPNLQRFMDEMKKRKAVEASLKQEGLA